MKLIFFNLLFTLGYLICNAQHNFLFRTTISNPNLELVYNDFENQFVPKIVDSLFHLRYHLEDGEKLVYWNEQNETPRFRFETKNGQVSGPFYSYNSSGVLTAAGNYFNDSLWTFRDGYFLISDTAYKVGEWLYFSCGANCDSTYYHGRGIQKTYKVPYDNFGKFHQCWTFFNGELWLERIYTAELGLTSEMVYYKGGSNYTSYEKYVNCSISKKWSSDESIEYISLDDQNSYFVNYQLGTIWSSKVVMDEGKEDFLSNPSGIEFQYRKFYPNVQIKSLVDKKAGLSIYYTEDGSVTQIRVRRGVKVKRR